MPTPLTDLERHVLDFLIAYLRRNTYQPSVREIGQRFAIKSTKTVSELLQSLADKGWIERDPSRSRGVRLLGVNLEPDTVTVPWYGRGTSTESESGPEPVLEQFNLDRKLAGANGVFMVAMPDDAMAGDGIQCGDLLLVEPVERDLLEDADIILVRHAGERMVKRLIRRGTESVLEASNLDYPPMLISTLDALVVEGRVFGIVRRLRAPGPMSLDPLRGT